MSISVGGLISGIDTESVIRQLLTLESQPIIKLQQQEAAYQLELTAYSSLRSILSNIKTTVQGLDAVSDLTSFSATSGDTDIFTVSAGSSAVEGSYDITVEQLALAHKVKSTAFTETEEVLEFKITADTNDKIDFKENGDAEELTATITAGNYTVSELEAEIKNQLETASDNAAVPNNINYTVSYDSSTKKFTIEEDGSDLTQLDVLWATGTNTAKSASSLLGFAAEDDTGALEYTSDNEVGEGTIHLEIQGTVHDISISATDTIEDVADAINDADAGVQAAVIFDGSEGSNYVLILTGEDTGADNDISITTTDPDGNNTDANGLSRLAEENLVLIQAARDSQIEIDSITVTRATNTIDDVIEGVTITLNDVHTGEPLGSDTLTVSRNTSAVVSKVNSFVSAYNNALAFFEANQGYNEETEVAGFLQGDSTTNNIRNSLRRLTSQVFPGVETFSRLSDIGIELNDDGRLEVDSSTLNDALDDHFDDVIQLFTQTTEDSEGFGVRMVNILDGFLDSYDGILTSRTDGIQDSIDNIDDKMEHLIARLEASEIRMRAQFNALELLLAQFQTTGDYLSQQILGMQNMNNYVSNR